MGTLIELEGVFEKVGRVGKNLFLALDAIFNLELIQSEFLKKFAMRAKTREIHLECNPKKSR